MKKYFSIAVILGILSGVSVVTYDETKVAFQKDQAGIGQLEGTMDRREFQIEIIAAPMRQIHQYCLEIAGKAVPGCARSGPGSCTIWIPEPIGMGDWTAFQIAGHELWHCKIGKYHK